MRFWFKKKAPPPVEKPRKPIRIAVHLLDGRTIVHYGLSSSVNKEGQLRIYQDKDGKGLVAEYVKGFWASTSSGKRSIVDMSKKEV